MAEDETPPRRELPLVGAPGTPTAPASALDTLVGRLADEAVPATVGTQAATTPAAVAPTAATPSTTTEPPIIPVDPVFIDASAIPLRPRSAGPARTVNIAGTRAERPSPPLGVPEGFTTSTLTFQNQGGVPPTPVTATGPSTAEPPVIELNEVFVIHPNVGPARTVDVDALRNQQIPPALRAQYEALNTASAEQPVGENSDPGSVRTLTDGSLPTQQAQAVQQEAADALARAQATPSAASPDVRAPGSLSTQTQVPPTNLDPSPLSPGDVLATAAMRPHKFSESKYPVYHHDIIVYIQGVDVSPWLTGTMTIINNVGAEPNSCDITLDNAMNRFLLTPENVAGSWRTSTDHDLAEFDESAKKAIYEIKSPLGNNPVDNMSGGRLWPLDLWSPILHKGDPIRVWIRNPLDPEADEYMPMFTGYVHNITQSGNYVDHSATLTISCKDIRYILRQMRVNTNTVFYVQPGEVLTENATQYSEVHGIELDRGGGAFSSQFFQDLVVNSTTWANPWANVPFFRLVRALTYAGTAEVQRIVNDAATAAAESLRSQIRDAERLVATANDQNRPQRQRNLQLLQERLARETNDPVTAPASAANTSASTTSATQPAAQSPAAAAPENAQSGPQPAPRTHGTGRVGRLRKGFINKFPSMEDLEDENDTPNVEAGAAVDGSALMSSWTSMVTFGLPEWSVLGETDNQGVPLDRTILKDTGTSKYWTLDQVQRTGENTRSNRACAPDTQMVHVLMPNVSSTGNAFLQDNNYAIHDNINVQRQWVYRNDLLIQACDAVDYKFYVSPTGDLVFEFPQFDFYPRDYNASGNVGWQPVYEFDFDLIDDTYTPEDGEVVNCVIATGGLTGYTDFIDVPGNGVQVFDPELFPHAVAYSPILTMRHGVNIHTISLPLITDKGKLARIAVFNFQKLLAASSHYNMDVAYRPWVGLNRPVMNKEFTRYALTESVTHTIGIRETAGPPVTNLTVSYPRNVDLFGIPRFLSGGPSLPIYFGLIPGRDESILSRLQGYSQQLTEQLAAFGTGSNQVTVVPLGTQAALDRQGAPIPYGYDVYNVIGATSGIATLIDSPDNVVEVQTQILQQLTAAQANIRSATQNRANGVLTQSEFDDVLEREAHVIQDARNRLEAMGRTVSESGTEVMQFGSAGVRTQDTRGTERTQELPHPTVEEFCDLDAYVNSSPLGRASDGSFPRKIVRTFSDSRRNPHRGVDYEATQGERVFCVHDGVVSEVGNSSEFGPFVRVQHDDLHVSSVYAPVSTSLTVDTQCYRNTSLGTVAGGGPEAHDGVTVLHFAFGTPDLSVGSAQGYVPPQVFPLQLRGRVPNYRNLAFKYYEQRGDSRDEANFETFHGGMDISWEGIGDASNPVYVVAATGGTIAKVYVAGVNAQEGNGVAIRDARGSRHGYFHFRDPVDQSVFHEGAPVHAGDVLGIVGSTGNSTGPHLHYQLEVGGTYGRRADVALRLAALAAGVAVVPELSQYEANHVFMVKQRILAARPIAVPTTAPATPIAGINEGPEAWRRIAGSAYHFAEDAIAASRARAQRSGLTSSQTLDGLPPSYTYFDTALPPTESLAVPYTAPPTNVATTDTLTFTLLGDATATTARPRLQAELRNLLSRPDLELGLSSVPTSSLSDWLVSASVASDRRNRQARDANRTTLSEAAQRYDVVLVSFVAGDDFTPENIVRINNELRAHNAIVLWLTHAPLSDRTTVSRGNTIASLVASGVPRAQVDSHARARAVLIASSAQVVDIGDAPIPVQRSDTGYTNHGLLNPRGQNYEASILGPGVVQALRALATTSPSTVPSTPFWSDAMPPEDCPPSRQRRLQGVQALATSTDPQAPPDPAPAPASTRPLYVYGGVFATNTAGADKYHALTSREVVLKGIAGADIAAWTNAITTEPSHDVIVYEFGDVDVPSQAEVLAADRELRTHGAVNVTWAVVDSWDSRAPVSIRRARGRTHDAIVAAGVTTASSGVLTRANGYLTNDYKYLTDSGQEKLAEVVSPSLSSSE